MQRIPESLLCISRHFITTICIGTKDISSQRYIFQTQILDVMLMLALQPLCKSLNLQVTYTVLNNIFITVKNTKHFYIEKDNFTKCTKIIHRRDSRNGSVYLSKSCCWCIAVFSYRGERVNHHISNTKIGMFRLNYFSNAKSSQRLPKISITIRLCKHESWINYISTI